MDPKTLKRTVWLGAIGGVATIVGVALPWLTDNSQGSGVSINGLIAGPYVLIFGAIMASASLFLPGDPDPRKVVAILGPASLAVLAYVGPIMFNKEAGLFGGISEGSSTGRGIGLYVCVLGGVLGLIAAAIVGKEVLSSSSPATGAPSGFDLGDVSEQEE